MSGRPRQRHSLGQNCGVSRPWPSVGKPSRAIASPSNHPAKRYTHFVVNLWCFWTLGLLGAWVPVVWRSWASWFSTPVVWSVGHLQLVPWSRQRYPWPSMLRGARDGGELQSASQAGAEPAKAHQNQTKASQGQLVPSHQAARANHGLPWFGEPVTCCILNTLPHPPPPHHHPSLVPCPEISGDQNLVPLLRSLVTASHGI